MGALPKALAAREQPRLLPFLPCCLRRLAASVPANAPTLLAVLKSCAMALQSPAGEAPHVGPHQPLMVFRPQLELLWVQESAWPKLHCDEFTC